MAHFVGYKPTGLYAPVFDVVDGDYSKKNPQHRHVGGRWNGSGPLEVLIFNKRQIGGAHVWIDKHADNTILVSNALAVAFEKATLTALEIGPEMQEVE